MAGRAWDTAPAAARMPALENDMAFEAIKTGPAGADSLVSDTTTAGFRQDVIAESMNRPVLVDFWAPWCGPCKQLTPVIEKAVRAAAGNVKLVKMNIDEHPAIAGQLGIQSIPAVIAFQGGKPVDGFMGAVPESQVKEFIAKLLGPDEGGGIAEALTEAEALAAAGEVQAAAQLYAAILAEEPDNLPALAAMARLCVEGGDLEGAKRFLGMVPAGKEADPAIAGARAALELAEKAAALGDLSELQRTVAANPADHQARFDLALGLAAGNDREAAVDHLVEIIKRDRAWNDDGARRQLVTFFEAWGPMDEMTIAGRRKLSTVLFR
jgi:putative thioredoxin